jgi:hypothetical protein
MPLKVIGAGFGRTGTSSLKLALEKLGFGKCYHMTELRANPQALDLWMEVLNGRADWEAIFRGYQSAVDWPACSFYKEHMAAYPDAKVVLTVRNPESWYRSVNETIYPISNLIAPKWLPWLPARLRKLHRLIFTTIWDGPLRGEFEDQKAAIDVFNEHIETVKREVPAERLLIFDVRDGWLPLCEFLGIDAVPDEPFPRVNEAAEIKRVVSILRWTWRAVFVSAILLITWGVIVIAF